MSSLFPRDNYVTELVLRSCALALFQRAPTTVTRFPRSLGGREDSVGETNTAQIESRINYSASSINCDTTLLWSSSWRVFDKRDVAECTLIGGENREDVEGIDRFSGQNFSRNTVNAMIAFVRNEEKRRKFFSTLLSPWSILRLWTLRIFPAKDSIERESLAEHNSIREQEVDCRVVESWRKRSRARFSRVAT